MIPLRDENPSGTFPIVTIGLIAANVLAFLYELSLGPGAGGLVRTYGLVPASVWSLAGMELAPAAEAAVRDAAPPVIPVFISVFTSMFLHGGLWHIVGNMWFLWLFGDNIEDRLGHVVYLLFYLVCGVGASAAHVFFSGASAIPMIGASGAISGVLGAYFICFPRARVLTLVPLFIMFFFMRVSAGFFLLFYIGMQVLNALASDPKAPGVAWWAHIGGFALGAALVMVLPRCKRSRQSDYAARPDAWRARGRGPHY